MPRQRRGHPLRFAAKQFRCGYKAPQARGGWENEVISSIQVGLVTGRGVDAPPAHQNLKPQNAAPVQQALHICCTSPPKNPTGQDHRPKWASRGWSYAKSATPRHGVLGGCGPGPGAWHPDGVFVSSAAAQGGKLRSLLREKPLMATSDQEELLVARGPGTCPFAGLSVTCRSNARLARSQQRSAFCAH